MDKASPGSPFRVPPAGIWNGMVAAGLAYTSGEELGVGGGLRGRQIDTNCVVLRNDSGGALVRGRVLEIGAKLITTPTPEALWFEGDTPAPDGADLFAITKYPVLTSGLVLAQVSGLVLARINMNQIQQTFADVDSASTLLQSKWHGRAKILWKSTASTGEQDALVQLGVDFRGPINAIITQAGGIAAGGSGNVAVQWAGAAASPASSATAWLSWMNGGVAALENDEVQIWWHPDQQKYVIGNMECNAS